MTHSLGSRSDWQHRLWSVMFLLCFLTNNCVFMRNMGWCMCIVYISIEFCALPTNKLWKTCIYFLNSIFFFFQKKSVRFLCFLGVFGFLLLFIFLYFFTPVVYLSCYSVILTLPQAHAYVPLVSTNGKTLTLLLSHLIILTLLPRLLLLCSPDNSEFNQSEPSVKRKTSYKVVGVAYSFSSLL